MSGDLVPRGLQQLVSGDLVPLVGADEAEVAGQVRAFLDPYDENAMRFVAEGFPADLNDFAANLIVKLDELRDKRPGAFATQEAALKRRRLQAAAAVAEDKVKTPRAELEKA